LSESDHPDPGITHDPLATGPQDLAEYEAFRQAHLEPKVPVGKQVHVDAMLAEAGQRRDANAERLKQQRQADFERQEQRRLRVLAEAARPRKSGKGPLAIALIAGAAFLFLRANQAPATPATPATQATVAPAGPSWTAYVARTATWGTTMAADSRALASDASAYDVSSLSDDARTLQTDAEAYSFWLDQLGILPCYHAVWMASQTAAAAYVQAGKWAAKWADAAPNGNPDDLIGATNYLNEASSDVDQVTSQAQSVSCP